MPKTPTFTKLQLAKAYQAQRGGTLADAMLAVEAIGTTADASAGTSKLAVSMRIARERGITLSEAMLIADETARKNRTVSRLATEAVRQDPSLTREEAETRALSAQAWPAARRKEFGAQIEVRAQALWRENPTFSLVSCRRLAANELLGGSR